MNLDIIEKNKERFMQIYNKNIHRDGADRLLKWLERTDFFEAPASTRYHLCEPGGLCLHSLNVYNRLVTEYTIQKRLAGLNDNLTDEECETIAICALLHDICKTNYYKLSKRNVKNEVTGKWESVPYYTVEDSLPYGHGEKSVYMIQGFIKLSREEAMAIRWHMGGFDDVVKGGSSSQSEAFSKYKLAVLLHISDLKSTYLDE